MLRQVAFGNAKEADGFLSNLSVQLSESNEASASLSGNRTSYAGSRPGLSNLSHQMWESLMFKHNGTPIVTSSRMREYHLYDRQPNVAQCDIDYLHARDAVVRTIHNKPTTDAWMKPPRTGNKRLDAVMLKLRRIGFFKAAARAHARARRDGYSFLYIKAGGDAGADIMQDGSQWRGFQLVKKANVDWKLTKFDPEDPLLPHNIQRLAVTNSNGQTVYIHGTRLLAFVSDPDEDDITLARPFIESAFDDIQDFRDYRFMLHQPIVEGNPFVITVETDAPMGQKSLTDDEAQDMQNEVAELRGAFRDAFGPNENVKIERVGAADVREPEYGIRSTVGAIAAICELTTNMLMPFSRGSEQVTDQDRNDYGDNVEVLREVQCWPILDRVVELSKISGFAGAKRGVELPNDLQWPYVRKLQEREQAFVDARDATTIRELHEVGRLPNSRIGDKYQKDPSFVPEPEASVTRRPTSKGQPGASVLDEGWIEYNKEINSPLDDQPIDE